MHRRAFEAFAGRKMRAAERATIYPLTTIEDRSSAYSLEAIGNEWSRRLYDGPFHLVPVVSGFSRTGFRTSDPGPRIPVPSISLVFVQSKDGNTGTDRPEDLGGGATDKHLIYEGLSRVAADAVLAGASTAAGENVFFSVWHPELVALRLSLGLPRHPAQVVVTGRACIDPNTSLIFNVPDVAVFVLASVYACGVLANAAASRPWVRLVRIEGEDLRPALSTLLREFGIRRLSCIGGRTTATALLDASVVDDLYLTTSARGGGDPDTPFYVGQRPPTLEPIVRKRGLDPQAPIRFEHFRVSGR